MFLRRLKGTNMSTIPQHKRLAMGDRVGFKNGGFVSPTKSQSVRPGKSTGIPDTPVEKSKRSNGIPGMKKGGCACP